MTIGGVGSTARPSYCRRCRRISRPPRAVLPPAGAAAAAPSRSARFVGQSDPRRPLGLQPGVLQVLLCVAGVTCCVAMSMPQVHIVAYCTDLGAPHAGPKCCRS
jgi:hypothetical protein